MQYKPFNNETTRSSVLKAVADTTNSAAWRRFYDLYAGFVYSIARSRGMNEGDAEEIVQSVFVDLARTLGTFEYNRAKGKFRNYLIGLVVWRVTDRLRAQKKEAEAIADLVSHLPELRDSTAPAVTDFDEREWLSAAREEALRRLRVEANPAHYAAFVASMIDGMDTETVTRLHGITRDNLYQIRLRLSNRLKAIVAEVTNEMDNGLDFR